LLIEDSQTQALALQRVLRESGYECDIARSGEEGLSRLAGFSYDLILTDIQMPGLSGYDVCRRVKTDPVLARLPVILLTSFGKPVDFIRGLECGADAFVNKPYERADLLGRITQLLEARDPLPDSRSTTSEVILLGERFHIQADTPRMLSFLAATFEDYARTKQREHDFALERERHSLQEKVHKAREEHLLREQEHLKRTQTFLQTTLDSLTARIAILDAHGTILALNQAWILSHSINPLVGPACGVGTPYLQVCETSAATGLGAASSVATGITTVLAGRRDHYDLEYLCSAEDGSNRWFSARITRFPGDGPVRVVVAHEDITQRKLAEERLRHQAFHDTLTGLPNRALLEERLQDALNRLARRGSGHIAVLFLDFDGFKYVNDSLGHVYGDQLLVAVSRRLEQCLRRVDSVARLGGDEFVVLADEIRGVADATRLAERIQESLRTPFHVAGHELFVSASIGIALGQVGQESPGELLRDADTAMYQAKSLGRGRHVVFDRAMHTRILNRLRLESDLRRALEHDEIHVHYQPIVDLHSGRIVGFEALARWRQPERGWVPPIEFIPIAEETQLIQPLGLSLLREACLQLRSWRDLWDEARSWYVSVNLSGRQLIQLDLVERIAQVLQETGMEPTRLRLEITESIAIENFEKAQAVLSRLRGLGIPIALDDFGTGYSSLSYLHRLPLDVIKIDRSFVNRLDTSDDDAGMLRTMLALADNLGLDVVVEGIESAGQRGRLVEMGYRYGQGYLFSKALEPDRMTSWFLSGIWSLPDVTQVVPLLSA
jgi:diguanylate cyclase (GGDEF)-like protein